MLAKCEPMSCPEFARAGPDLADIGRNCYGVGRMPRQAEVSGQLWPLGLTGIESNFGEFDRLGPMRANIGPHFVPRDAPLSAALGVKEVGGEKGVAIFGEDDDGSWDDQCTPTHRHAGTHVQRTRTWQQGFFCALQLSPKNVKILWREYFLGAGRRAVTAGTLAGSPPGHKPGHWGHARLWAKVGL